MRRFVFLVALALIAITVRALKAGDDPSLSTNYVAVQYNFENQITIGGLFADFLGEKNFTSNILGLPIQLEVQEPVGLAHKQSHRVSDLKKSAEGKSQLSVKSEFLLDDVPAISQNVQISVSSTRRTVEVLLNGEVLQDLSVIAVSLGVYVKAPSLYGLFSTGVAQMMGKAHSCLASADPLERVYFLGDGNALDVIVTNPNSYETILTSSTTGSYKSALQHVVFGQAARKTKEMSLAWNNNCFGNTTTTVKAGSKFSVNITLIPNNFDFPAYLFADIPSTSTNIPFKDLRTSLTGAYGSAAGCLESYYNNQQGIIAPTIAHPDIGYSPDTNFFDPDNFITLSAMLYSGDQYLVNQVKQVLLRTSETMCGIGSGAIAGYCDQSRLRTRHSKMIRFQHHDKILNGKHQLLSSKLLSNHRVTSMITSSNYAKFYASSSRAGQLMHHYVNLVPTYESIAGSEQLGPNIFWTMAVWKYISLTQDYSFAQEIFPYVDLSSKFVLSFIDKDYFLINAPGPLWIDVLIREQYTSDSNAIIVPFIEEMIEYYSFMDEYNVRILGESEKQFDHFILELSGLKEKIIAAYNKYLWISNVNNATVNNTNDHFITQLNEDFVSYRDFIDYDSNLMAVAFKIVTDADQVNRLIKRVDSGPYTHVRATWCSEIPYTGDADDCYIVGGSVCGDSVVTLARIGYIDGIARKQINDVNTYQNLLLSPLQDDLIRDVWLYERYDSNGNQIRTSYYFEYPSLITMFVREISYGIEVKLNDIVIHPFTSTNFTYNIGHNFYVQYETEKHVRFAQRPLSSDAVSDSSKILPKKVTIYGLKGNKQYSISNSCDGSKVTSTASSSGLLQTSVKLAPHCTFDVTLI